MADIKLIGNDSLTFNDSIASIRPYYQKFAALYTASVTKIRVQTYVAQNGNVKLAIFADNINTPGELLTQTGAAPVVKNSMNLVPITPVSITAGTYYWLAVVCDMHDCIGRVTSGGVTKYGNTVTFATYQYISNPSGLGSLSSNFGLAGMGAVGGVGLIGDGLVGNSVLLSRGLVG